MGKETRFHPCYPGDPWSKGRWREDATALQVFVEDGLAPVAATQEIVDGTRERGEKYADHSGRLRMASGIGNSITCASAGPLDALLPWCFVRS